MRVILFSALLLPFWRGVLGGQIPIINGVFGGVLPPSSQHETLETTDSEATVGKLRGVVENSGICG